jgi:FkbM family methyltransferase
MVKQVHGAWLPDREEYLVGDIAVSPRFAGGPTVQLKKYLAALPAVRQFRHAVDIGANIGLWTRVMAACFDRVTAFEPNAECHEAFWLNNESDEFVYAEPSRLPALEHPRITLHALALGAEPATIALNTKLRSTGFTTVDDAGDLEVEQRTLDSFDLRNVDLIKIDVEGWEHNVVKGGIETIQRCRPVMIVEQKPNNAERHGLKQFGAVNLLKKWGAVQVADMAGDIIMRFP